MANAQMAHALAHWRYHLNEWVVDYLKQEGYCTPVKVVERDEWKTSKRREYANEIVDHMERVGEVRKLYRDFKNETEHAHNKPVRCCGLAMTRLLLTSYRCPHSAMDPVIDGLEDGPHIEIWWINVMGNWSRADRPHSNQSHILGFVVGNSTIMLRPILQSPHQSRSSVSHSSHDSLFS